MKDKSPSWDDIKKDFDNWFINNSGILPLIPDRDKIYAVTLHMAVARDMYNYDYGTDDVRSQMSEEDMEQREKLLADFYITQNIAKNDKTAHEHVHTFKNDAAPVLTGLSGQGHGRGG